MAAWVTRSTQLLSRADRVQTLCLVLNTSCMFKWFCLNLGGACLYNSDWPLKPSSQSLPLSGPGSRHTLTKFDEWLRNGIWKSLYQRKQKISNFHGQNFTWEKDYSYHSIIQQASEHGPPQNTQTLVGTKLAANYLNVIINPRTYQLKLINTLHTATSSFSLVSRLFFVYYIRVICKVPYSGGAGPKFCRNWGRNEKSGWRQYTRKKKGYQASFLT
jgi:hypothetical protein